MEAPAGLDDGLSATAGALAAAPRDISIEHRLAQYSYTGLLTWFALARSHL
jgi:hypothetical protein